MEQARSRSSEDTRRVDRAGSRSRWRRRGAAALIVVAALSVIIVPHLVDSSRISSVAAKAASDALITVTCPAATSLTTHVNPPDPVELNAVAVCHYPAGPVGTPPVVGRVPHSQLVAVNTDLQAHAVMGSAPRPKAPPADSGAQPETWAVIGLTSSGQTVELTGNPFPGVLSAPGPGPGIVWHPLPTTQRLLTADIGG